jgi:Predicted membrane protein (DUF2157)
MGKREIRWLYDEIPAWVRDGILSEQGAARLRTFYGEPEGSSVRNVALVICAALGAVLVGSGIILLFAHNWEEIPRTGRAAISLGLLVVAQALAGWVIWRRQGSRAWREGASTFLLLAVGATISLIGQTYQLPGSPRAFLFTWMLLSVPLVYLMDASLPAIFFLVGITAWGGFLPPEGYWYWPVAALIAPHLRSAARSEPSGMRTRLLFWGVALVLPFAATVTLSDTLHAFWIPTASAMLAFLYLAGRFRPAESDALWPEPLHKVGAFGVPVICFMLSFKPPWEEVARHLEPNFRRSGNLWIDLVPISAICLGIVLLLRKRLRTKRYSGLLYGLAPFLTIPAYLLARGGYGTWPAVLILNAYVFTLGLGTAISGLREQSMPQMNAGLLVLAALIMARFFDSQFEFAVRGVAFIVLGVGFLAANVYLVRRTGGGIH